MENWKTVLKEKLPLLGHRNWIVVTDMAYPLQTKPGITTLFAEEPFQEVVSCVSGQIAQAPHVFAHVYLDVEQQAMSEQLAPGWDAYCKGLYQTLDQNDVSFIPHEELIRRLDEVSQLYQVIIIKTNLTIPYSSAFFELDCAYWDADREKTIRQ
ncbi:MAG: hypothetical protein IJR87_03655 [Bacteroidaceae bacterium]|nr:hypothetical protein [Bacteroidaceae bacterium]